MKKEELVKLLDLKPLFGEGGLYKQTYISDETLPETVLPGREGAHELGSAIFYLLTPETFSRMHRLSSDEVYHFYMGASVEMLQLYPDGTGRILRLGHDLAHGEQLQAVVPRGVWQGVRMVGEGDYALVGTTMAPAYHPSDYEDGVKEELIKAYPAYRDLLEVLADEPRY